VGAVEIVREEVQVVGTHLEEVAEKVKESILKIIGQKDKKILLITIFIYYFLANNPKNKNIYKTSFILIIIKMRDKNLILGIATVFSLLLVSGVVSAYACSIQPTCAAENTVMKLSSPDNAHGALYNQGSYTQYLCCDFTGTHTCDGTNKVLGLYDPFNSHAEIPERDEYTNDVCFGNLECRSTTGSPNADEFGMVSLHTNNSHIDAIDVYPNNIYCKYSGCDQFPNKTSCDTFTLANPQNWGSMECHCWLWRKCRKRYFKH
jgi:hypothetical protein